MNLVVSFALLVFPRVIDFDQLVHVNGEEICTAFSLHTVAYPYISHKQSVWISYKMRPFSCGIPVARVWVWVRFSLKSSLPGRLETLKFTSHPLALLSLSLIHPLSLLSSTHLATDIDFDDIRQLAKGESDIHCESALAKRVRTSCR